MKMQNIKHCKQPVVFGLGWKRAEAPRSRCLIYIYIVLLQYKTTNMTQKYNFYILFKQLKIKKYHRFFLSGYDEGHS